MVSPLTFAEAITYPIVNMFAANIEPQIGAELYQEHGGQFNTAMMIMRYLGREIAKKDDHWSEWEEGWVQYFITNLTTVTNLVPGAESWVTLSPSDHMTGGYVYPIVGHVCTLAGNLVNCRVQDIDYSTPTAVRIKIRPFRTIDAIGTIAAGQPIIFTSNAYASGTGQPKGQQNWPSKRTFYMQLFKKSLSIEGGEITRPLYYRVYAADGQTIQGIWSPNYIHTHFLYEKDMGGAFIMGQDADNLTADAAEIALYEAPNGLGNPVLGTKGIWNWTGDRGKTFNVPITTTAIDDFEDIIYYIEGQRINTRDILMMAGTKRLADYSSVFKTFIQGNGSDLLQGIVNSIFEQSMRGYSVLANFTAFEYLGYKFLCNPLDEFNDPRTLNASGYDFGENALIVPIDKVKTKGGKFVPNFATCYLDNNGYNRRLEEWYTGGAGGDFKYTNGMDVKNLYMRGTGGFQILGANAMVRQLS